MRTLASLAVIALLIPVPSTWASPTTDKATSRVSSSPATQSTLSGETFLEKLRLAEDDTAACLTQCKKDFDSCSNGGKDNIPACIKKRTDCYNKCGSK